MRLHDRYIFRELMTPLVFLSGGFFVIGISLFFTKELETIQEKKLTLMESAAYCATSLPAFFVLILPILLLLALLYALTHHARYNEITALRAAGVSLWRLCAPYFIVGVIATAAYFALNELAVPACDQWAADLLSRHVKKDVTTKAKSGSLKVRNTAARRTWMFTELDPIGGRLTNPTVEWDSADGSWKLIESGSAVYANHVWTFHDVHRFVSQQTGKGEPKPAVTTNVVTVAELDETPQKLQTLLKYADSRTLRASGNADIPLSELWSLLHHQQYLKGEDINAVRTKFYGRLATPFECLVVVLVAIPFGAPSGRRNLFVGVASSIVIGFAYFILLRFSLAFGMAGHLPGWLAAWLPNFLFAAAGIVLTLRVR